MASNCPYFAVGFSSLVLYDPIKLPWRYPSCDWPPAPAVTGAVNDVDSEKNGSSFGACASRQQQTLESQFLSTFVTLRKTFGQTAYRLEARCGTLLAGSSRIVSGAKVRPGCTTVYFAARYAEINHLIGLA